MTAEGIFLIGIVFGVGKAFGQHQHVAFRAAGAGGLQRRFDLPFLGRFLAGQEIVQKAAHAARLSSAFE
jgi:hypothetical protein